MVPQPGFTLFMLGSKQDAAFPDRRIAMRVVNGCLSQMPLFSSFSVRMERTFLR